MTGSIIWARGRAALALGGLALLIVPMLGGCAPQRQWSRPGIVQTEFDRDAAACRRQASRATYQDPFAFASGRDQSLEHTVAQEKVFEQCMFEKGYRLEEKPANK